MLDFLPVDGTLLQIHINSDFETTFGSWTYGPVLGNVTRVIFGIKEYGDDLEANSILRADNLVGLLILNRAVPDVALQPEVSVTYNATTYVVTLQINKPVTSLLTTHERWIYELQFIHDTGKEQSMLFGQVITKGSAI